MNKNQDSKLREVLGTWEVNPRPAPHFKAAVWQRIAVQEARATTGIWSTLRDWLFVQLPKPAYAAALLAVTAITGVTVANTRAERAREQYRLDSARHYLASIDPMAMTASASRALR